MKLISLNAWGGRLYDKLINFLGSEMPEVLCLQEVYNITQKGAPFIIDQTWGNEKSPVRLNLLHEILKSLDKYNYCYCPSYRKVFEVHPEGMTSAIFGNAIIFNREFEVLNYNEVYLYKEFQDVGPFDKDMPRKAQCIRLRLKSTGKLLTIANLHGIWGQQFGKESQEIILQGEKIVLLVESTRSQSDNLIICGDFNVPPSSKLFQTLACFEIENLVNSAKINSTRTSLYSGKNHLTDYILTSKFLHKEKFEIREYPEVSDHKALILLFDI